MYTQSKRDFSEVAVATKEDVENLKRLILDSTERSVELQMSDFKGSLTNHGNLINLTENRDKAPNNYKPINGSNPGFTNWHNNAKVNLPGVPFYQVNLYKVSTLNISIGNSAPELSFINGVPGGRYSISVENRGSYQLKFYGINIPMTLDYSTKHGTEAAPSYSLYTILCIKPNVFVLETVINLAKFV